MRVYLDSVGCRLNQSEIETYARQFEFAGHNLVGDPAAADLAVINTCGVTASAAADSRKVIRRSARLGAAEVVVTGCWSDLEREQAASLPGVSRVIANQHKDDLVAQILEIPAEDFDLEPLARNPLPGNRARTRAFIKVQDGCDNRCTFCVTTIARGEGRSRSIAAVKADVQAALRGGAKEVVLTGVHLGSWGQDFDEQVQLRDLIRAILEIEELPRLRLSSLEPWDLDAGFFDLWQDARLCRHLHLPLQSGSAATLRRMARNTTPGKFAALAEAARARIPDLALTTDLIAGFPGESNAEFKECLNFVRAMEFADAHVFTYSEREGTAAAKMPDPVHNATRKQRSTLLRQAVAESSLAFRKRFVGRELEVLWESEDALDGSNWRLSGHTDNYLRVETASAMPLWNQITPIQLTGVSQTGLRGSLSNQPEHIWFLN